MNSYVYLILIAAAAYYYLYMTQSPLLQFSIFKTISLPKVATTKDSRENDINQKTPPKKTTEEVPAAMPLVPVLGAVEDTRAGVI
jgi:hypothetical protein